LLGAAGGCLIYSGAAMYLFPLAETDEPLALAWQARLLARLLPALGAAALLAAKWPGASRQAV
jgi:hypothetical protein